MARLVSSTSQCSYDNGGGAICEDKVRKESGHTWFSKGRSFFSLVDRGRAVKLLQHWARTNLKHFP